jgi:anti-sigma factor RsiW
MAPDDAREIPRPGCRTEKELSAFDRGELEPRLSAAIRSHLIACAACRSTLRDLVDEADERELSEILSESDRSLSPSAREEIIALVFARLSEDGPARDSDP